jgi:hypothetical protein
MVLCEKAAPDKDGFLTLHRVFTAHSFSGETEAMPELPLRISAVISFEVTDRTETWDVRFTMVTPEDVEQDIGVGQFGLVGDQLMPLRIVAFNYTALLPGLFRFRAYHDDVVLADYPFTLTYHWAQETPGVQ